MENRIKELAKVIPMPLEDIKAERSYLNRDTLEYEKVTEECRGITLENLIEHGELLKRIEKIIEMFKAEYCEDGKLDNFYKGDDVSEFLREEILSLIK